VDPLKIIAAVYPQGSTVHEILVAHSNLVAQKALSVARRLSHLNPDMDFIYEAAMLHDIGIVMTQTPELGCHGTLPYICHGYTGRAILEKAGLDRHSLVCERHVGVGISMDDIRFGNLPIPLHDMMPESLEERIICYADKFFSKTGSRQPVLEKSAEEIVAGLSRYGPDKVDRFLSWHRQFECHPRNDFSQGQNVFN
jgi:uncharacterized protein